MGRREGWGEVGGCALLALLCIAVVPALYFARRAPQHFSSAAWCAAAPTNRLAMANSFVAGGTWRGASQAELTAWLGEPTESGVEASWPLPDAIAELTLGEPGAARLPAGGQRLTFGCKPPCFRLLLDRDDPRSEDVRYLAHIHFPAGVMPTRLPGPAFGMLGAAALLSASETLTLTWLAETGGFIHEAATLAVRLIDDQGVAAWVSLH